MTLAGFAGSAPRRVGEQKPITSSIPRNRRQIVMNAFEFSTRRIGLISCNPSRSFRANLPIQNRQPSDPGYNVVKFALPGGVP